MRNLSREQELERRIYLLEESSENKKWKRTKITFFVLSAVVYLIAFMCDGMKCVQDYLLGIVAAPICAGFVMFISCIVLFYMLNGATQENKEINRLKGELDAIRSMNIYQHNKADF